MTAQCLEMSLQSYFTGKRVLLVEDEGLIRLWLADELIEAGFEVVEAENGDRAVQLMSPTEAFDLLITDIQMPGSADGNAVATAAKQHFPGLPVIYASGRPTSLTNSVGHCDAFIAKPFTAATVLAIARRLLGGRRPPSPPAP